MSGKREDGALDAKNRILGLIWATQVVVGTPISLMTLILGAKENEFFDVCYAYTIGGVPVDGWANTTDLPCTAESPGKYVKHLMMAAAIVTLTLNVIYFGLVTNFKVMAPKAMDMGKYIRSAMSHPLWRVGFILGAAVGEFFLTLQLCRYFGVTHLWEVLLFCFTAFLINVLNTNVTESLASSLMREILTLAPMILFTVTLWTKAGADGKGQRNEGRLSLADRAPGAETWAIWLTFFLAWLLAVVRAFFYLAWDIVHGHYLLKDSNRELQDIESTQKNGSKDFTSNQTRSDPQEEDTHAVAHWFFTLLGTFTAATIALAVLWGEEKDRLSVDGVFVILANNFAVYCGDFPNMVPVFALIITCLYTAFYFIHFVLAHIRDAKQRQNRVVMDIFTNINGSEWILRGITDFLLIILVLFSAGVRSGFALLIAGLLQIFQALLWGDIRVTLKKADGVDNMLTCLCNMLVDVLMMLVILFNLSERADNMAAMPSAQKRMLYTYFLVMVVRTSIVNLLWFYAAAGPGGAQAGKERGHRWAYFAYSFFDLFLKSFFPIALATVGFPRHVEEIGQAVPGTCYGLGSAI